MISDVNDDDTLDVIFEVRMRTKLANLSVMKAVAWGRAGIGRYSSV